MLVLIQAGRFRFGARAGGIASQKTGADGGPSLNPFLQPIEPARAQSQPQPQSQQRLQSPLQSQFERGESLIDL